MDAQLPIGGRGKLLQVLKTSQIINYAPLESFIYVGDELLTDI